MREARREYGSARYYYERALHEATAHGAADAAARSLHDLLSEAINARQPRRADRLAPLVFAAYAELQHENMYRFAHDLARFWLTEGCFAAALPIFEAVADRFSEDERPYVWGNIAEAAGAVGNRELVERVSISILSAPDATFFARGLTGLAAAWEALGEHDSAAALARRAWEEAARRGDVYAMEDARIARQRARRPTAAQLATRSALANELVAYSRDRRRAA